MLCLCNILFTVNLIFNEYIFFQFNLRLQDRQPASNFRIQNELNSSLVGLWKNVPFYLKVGSVLLKNVRGLRL